MRQAGSVAVHLVVDSTGLKIFGEGEWLAQKHEIKRIRRRWRKLHLGLDLASGAIVCADRTHDDVGDSTALPDGMDSSLMTQLGIVVPKSLWSLAMVRAKHEDGKQEGVRDEELAVDLAKAGISDRPGQMTKTYRLSRGKFLSFFAQELATVVMEACSAVTGDESQKLGHTVVRQYVRTYRGVRLIGNGM